MPTSPALFALFLATLPLPGALAVLGTGLHRPARSPALAAALALLVSCAFTSAVALAAAVAGVFGLGVVTAAQAVAAAIAAAAWRTRLRPALAGLAGEARRVRPAALAAGLAAAAAIALLHLQPYEQVLGGQDPAVYVNTGASLARTGAITVADPGYAALAPEERALFTHVRRGVAARVPGFLVRDAGRGVIQPYFNHLYPVWIALLDAGLGPRAGLYAGPLFSLGATGLVGLLGALLFSARAGVAAALLYGLSVPAIWAARFQVAEPLALFFSLGGWIGAVLFARHGRRAHALLAAALFGCALLAKITTLPPLALLAGAAVALAAAARDRARLLLPAALGAVAVVAAPYLLLFCREYAQEVLRSFAARRGLGAPGAALLTAGGAAAALGAGFAAARVPRAARAAAGALLVALAAYGWFVRPAVERSSDAANLPQLGWFLGAPALLLALAGALFVLARPGGGRRGEAQLLWLAAAAAAGAMLLHHKQVAPVYPWALRRYVPELLPLLALAGGAALGALAGGAGRHLGRPLRGRVLWSGSGDVGSHGGRPPGRGLRVAAAGALGALAIGLGLARGWHLLPHRDLAGALALVGRVAAAVPSKAAIVCEDGGLATPLLYLHGRETYAAADLTPARGRLLARTLAAWGAAGREVVFASTGGGVFSRGLGLELVARVPFDLPLLDRTTRAYPRWIRRLRADMHLFRVVPPGAPGAWRPARVEIGTAPFGLDDGFLRAERAGDEEGGEEPAVYRWTTGRATVDLPAPPRRDLPAELVLRLGGGRPAGSPSPSVRVLVDGREVAALAGFGAAIAERRIPLPPGAADPGGRGFVEVTVESDTFSPPRPVRGAEGRPVGVMWESAGIDQRP